MNLIGFRLFQIGTSIVNCEMLFPNVGTGLATLRFPSKQETFRLYKNGVEVRENGFSYSEQSRGKNIVILDYSSADIYTCKYLVDTSIGDPNMIDFSKYSSQQIFLRSFIKDGVLGENLSINGSQNSVNLSYNPYVDYSKFSGYDYLETIGTVGPSDYSPIQVQLEDGSYAINLTNYLSNKYFKYYQPTSEDNNVYYIHNRK